MNERRGEEEKEKKKERKRETEGEGWRKEGKSGQKKVKQRKPRERGQIQEEKRQPMKEKKTEENKEKRREHCVKAACARGIINQRAGGGSLSHRHTETNVLSYDDYSFYLSRSFYSFLPSQSPGDLQEISPATRSIRNAFNRRPESSIRILFEY